MSEIRNGRRTLIGQSLISAFIIYHLFSVVLTPLLIPPFGDRIDVWIRPYVASFALGNLWEFFSPNPSVPFWVSWEGDDQNGVLVRQGIWPRAPHPRSLADVEIRKLAALYFMMGSDQYIERMLGPYLCSLDVRFRSLRIWKEFHPVPLLTNVLHSVPGTETSSGDRKFSVQTFCGGNPG